jgi:hypothetical protein
MLDTELDTRDLEMPKQGQTCKQIISIQYVTHMIAVWPTKEEEMLTPFSV